MNSATEQACQQIIRQQQETIRLQAEAIRQQQTRIVELEKKVEGLSAQVARLSKNSSKPPFSDITRPTTKTNSRTAWPWSA